jgi:hypothetical protein
MIGGASAAHDPGVGGSAGPRRRAWDRVPRNRRGEFVAGIASAAVLVVSLLLVAGFVPGVFASSPFGFTQQGLFCQDGAVLSAPTLSQSHVLPAWATVHADWAIKTPAGLFVLYSVTTQTGDSVYSAFGTMGNASFVSTGGSYGFTVVTAQYFQAPSNRTCSSLVVDVTVSYTLG